jgi:FAD/FMN-containing dehydrogenase
MKRRNLLHFLATLPLLSGALRPSLVLCADSLKSANRKLRRRRRPTDPDWPKNAHWEVLSTSVGGRLIRVQPPLNDCLGAPANANCDHLFSELGNPYFIGDEPGLTQTLGWVDAWTFAPSVFAVAAATASDVVSAVGFARDNDLRLVVKGGGHSYQGTSNSADSLLIWTRHMNAIELHEAFIPEGCAATDARQAVSIGAGAMWMQVYDVVTTQHGRYVQGGGCATVGVAGLVQSGGFGSFSKAFGSAAGSLLEAEVVTADGVLRVANSRTNSDLFWSLKGGGGGSFGVVTKLTLETYELPALFGVVNATIEAKSDVAFRRLIELMLTHYRDHLMNPNWGEQIILKTTRRLIVQMLFQGIDRDAAIAAWTGFFQAIEVAPDDFAFESKPLIIDFPARHFWDPEFLSRMPGATKSDDRAGSAAGNLYWAGDASQCGQVLHGYDSVWLPAALLDDARIVGLTESLYAATLEWEVSLHINKGLAGAPKRAIDAARDTAMNPAVLSAFALAILGAEEPPAYPGIPGHEPHIDAARKDANAIRRAMQEIRKVVPSFASYVAESNFFESEWQSTFWGDHYRKLLAVKAKYDPDGLFFVHHGAGSESWSADGFTRLD